MVARPALAEEGPPPPPGETMWQPEAVEQSRESGKREANWTMWSEKQPRAKACTSQTQNPQNPDTAFPLSGLLMKHYKVIYWMNPIPEYSIVGILRII